MKRIIALLLMLATVLTSTVSLSGCSSSSEDSLEMGQWLGMINNAFGMESYAEEEPLISTVSADDEYFGTVQIAAEWDVIQDSGTFNPHEKLLWRDALITLVNAGEFVESDTSDSDKISYAISSFDDSIRDYWMDRTIDVESASELLVTAQEQWANKTYDTLEEKVEYCDGVINLSEDNESYVGYDSESGIITVNSNDKTSDIEQGDIIVVPVSDNSGAKTAYKAAGVKEENGVKYITTSDEELELGDIVDELYVEESYEPNLSEATIYDGNGNLIQEGSSLSSANEDSDDISSNISLLSATGGSGSEAAITETKNSTKKTSFEVSGCKVELSINDESVSAKVEVPLSDDEKTKGTFSTEVSGFKVTNKIDFGLFKLNSAEIKVDYTTENTVGLERELVKKEAVYAPKWSNGNGKFLTNLKKSVWKSSSSKGAKTIKIAKIDLASIGIASISLDINAKFKIDGTIEVTCTENGCKGIEYKGGKCRVINTSKKNTEVEAKCKAEATVSVGPTANALGCSVVGASAEIGLGMTAAGTLHLADSENHLIEVTTDSDIPPEAYEETTVTGMTADASEIQKLAESQGGTYSVSAGATVDLHLDVCIDINVYFILKVGVTEGTMVSKLLKACGVTTTWEICNSKNANLLKLHIEDFDFTNILDECTKEYTPFDGTEDESSTQSSASSASSDDSSTKVGEVLTLSTMNAVLEPSESMAVIVTQLPKGYELGDVVYKSKDTNVATVSDKGIITAAAEGTTAVIVATSDGKYSCACTVAVVNENAESFTPLNYSDADEYMAYAV